MAVVNPMGTFYVEQRDGVDGVVLEFEGENGRKATLFFTSSDILSYHHAGVAHAYIAQCFIEQSGIDEAIEYVDALAAEWNLSMTNDDFNKLLEGDADV